MARTYGQLSAAFGWTDTFIGSLPLNRIRQACAVAAEQAWAADLAARRLATVQMRTLCTFIALSIPFDGKEGESPVTMAQEISLGDGTETAASGQVSETIWPEGQEPPMPGATINLADLPEAPAELFATVGAAPGARDLDQAGADLFGGAQ